MKFASYTHTHTNTFHMLTETRFFFFEKEPFVIFFWFSRPMKKIWIIYARNTKKWTIKFSCEFFAIIFEATVFMFLFFFTAKLLLFSCCCDSVLFNMLLCWFYSVCCCWVLFFCCCTSFVFEFLSFSFYHYFTHRQS